MNGDDQDKQKQGFRVASQYEERIKKLQDENVQLREGGAAPEGEFKFIPLPDGSLGKFRKDQSEEDIQKLVQKDFPDFGKSATGEPSATFTKQAEPPKQEGAILNAVKKAALPTVGAVGGGLAGGLITSPTVAGVPVGVLAGEMAGGALGEKLNQYLGITDPSTQQVVLSGLAAPVGRGLAAVGSGLVGAAVKSVAGRDIMSESASSLLGKWLKPGVTSGELFQQAKQVQSFVPTIKTPQTIDRILGEEAHRAPTEIRQAIVAAIEPLKKHFIPGGGGIRAIAAPELMEEAQRLRFLSGQAFDAGNSKLGNAINSVRASILDDLENSGAGVVKEASRAYRKEMALEDLSKILGKPHPLQKVRDFMIDNPLFEGAFSKPEQEQILRIAKKLSYIPPSGGSGVIGKSVTGAAGWAVGGGPVGGLVGWFGPDAIRSLLGTQFGRNFTERILGSSPTLSHDALAALAVFAKGMTGKTPLKEPSAPPPKPIQKPTQDTKPTTTSVLIRKLKAEEQSESSDEVAKRAKSRQSVDDLLQSGDVDARDLKQGLTR